LRCTSALRYSCRVTRKVSQRNPREARWDTLIFSATCAVLPKLSARETAVRTIEMQRRVPLHVACYQSSPRRKSRWKPLRSRCALGSRCRVIFILNQRNIGEFHRDILVFSAACWMVSEMLARKPRCGPLRPIGAFRFTSGGI
jgi:hypothetical protein